MPRQARKLSRTGVYHVMLRGINRQDIFEDDGDYRQMTGCLRSLTERYDEMITRTVPIIQLDFLDKGRKYDCTIYADAKDAHYEKNPKAYTITKKVVKAGQTLKIAEAPGGGFAVSLIAQ